MAAAVLQSGTPEGDCIRFTWSDGFEAVVACAWLLDNAATARVSGSGQRLRSAASLAASGSLRAVGVTGDAVRLAFEHETVEWTGDALRSHASARDLEQHVTLWPHGADITARPIVPYDAYLADDCALRAALKDVVTFGLARLSGAGTDLNELERTVRRFGFIRETNYGRLFEVRVEDNPDNLANTARALEPHTDNPYRDPAPTLQMLHAIRSSRDGGATVFLDGFALAASFRDDSPDDFARLARLAVPFAFTDAAGNRYDARSPIIRMAADGEMAGIRFNHRSLGEVDFAASETTRWYESYMKFAATAAETGRRFSIALQPGDIVIFDNERILHGREAFAGSGGRLLKGCYADRDGLRATLARLEQAEVARR